MIEFAAKRIEYDAERFEVTAMRSQQTKDRIMSGNSLHVAPSSSGGWAVRHYGASRAAKTFASKSEALRYARALAEEDRSDVYVHAKDGTVAEREIAGPRQALRKAG